MSPHHSDQMSQGYKLFVKIKRSVTDSVSQSVTRSPIELFYAAKKTTSPILPDFLKLNSPKIWKSLMWSKKDWSMGKLLALLQVLQKSVPNTLTWMRSQCIWQIASFRICWHFSHTKGVMVSWFGVLRNVTKIIVWKTMVRFKVCNSGCFWLGSNIQHLHFMTFDIIRAPS